MHSDVLCLNQNVIRMNIVHCEYLTVSNDDDGDARYTICEDHWQMDKANHKHNSQIRPRLRMHLSWGSDVNINTLQKSTPASSSHNHSRWIKIKQT